MSTNEVAEAFKSWCQGDFVRLDGSPVPMIYASHRTDGNPGLYPVQLQSDLYKGYVVISQTCDINRSIDKVPVVLVVPLVLTNAHGEVRSGRMPKFAWIDGAPEGYVADLTTVMSVDKSYLSNWNRNVGFSTDTGRQRFARDLERSFGRFAFPDEFNEILNPLVGKVKDKVHKPNSDLGKKLLAIDEIRVATTASSWDDSVIEIYFIVIWSDSFDDADLKEQFRKEFTGYILNLSWNEKFKLAAFESGPVRFATYDDLTARDYLHSFLIDVMNLSFSVRQQDLKKNIQSSAGTLV